ncbi:MAG: flagellum-specific ATP synthase FliI, partial [Lysobacteraceae bacterium]
MNPDPQQTPPPADWAMARNLRLARRLDGLRVDTAHGRGLIREGVLRRAVGLTLEAVGCEAPLGASCKVEVVDGGWVDAEVVGFAGERTYLMPSAELHGLLPNARVVPSARRGGVEVGEGLLGRVIDSDGVPLDGKGPIRAEGHVGMAGVSINPLAREPITQPLDVGVRAINALLPIGRGQRVGLFAGSGVGKSTLLGMMTRYTAADVIVVGLIGERGREVQEF